MSYETEPLSGFFSRLCRLKKNQKFKEWDYRHAVNEVEIRRGVRAQIRAMREAKGISQEQLAAAVSPSKGTQPNISRLENGRVGYFQIKTLLGIAKAFDVGLVVRFVPFSELAEWVENDSPETLSPPNFDEEIRRAVVYEAAKAKAYEAVKTAQLTQRVPVLIADQPHTKRILANTMGDQKWQNANANAYST